jgi:sugar/nucleoside kinase (ribokinase family)
VPRPAVERAHALHLPAYSLLNEPLREASLSALEQARLKGRLVSVDLASRRPLLARGRQAAWQLIGEAGPDVLFANADEARALAGGDARRLLDLSPIVVVKEGQAGCRVIWSAAPSHGRASSSDVLELAVATRPLHAADTTGAGDAFDAGFLHSLIEQLPAGDATPGTGLRQARVLRRAAMAGHRAAGALLSRPRSELAL